MAMMFQPRRAGLPFDPVMMGQGGAPLTGGLDAPPAPPTGPPGQFNQPLIAPPRVRGSSIDTRFAAPSGMFGSRGGGLWSMDDGSRPGIEDFPDASTLKASRPGFFQAGGTGQKILRGLGDFALNVAAGEGDPRALGILRDRQARVAADRDEAMWQRRHDQERLERQQDRDAERNAPQFFTAGDDRVRYDPVTGQAETIYSAPTPAQRYADAMGYTPGTDDYRRAMRDQQLGAWGDTATENRLALDDERQRDRMELRSSPTYRDAHPRPRTPAASRPRAATTGAVIAPLLGKVAQGQPLAPGEQQALDLYYRRNKPAARTGGGPRGGGGGRPAEGAIAKNPATGQRIIYRHGAWVPF